MNQQQLELLTYTAKLGSISKAAVAMHISQPNASGWLKALEQELGAQLFRRNRAFVDIAMHLRSIAKKV